MIPNELLFLFFLFVIAFLYSSVGHGGGSGYLALMVLFGFTASMMRSTALVLNIFVSGIAFVNFYNAGLFRWKIFFPFAVGAIPFSFLGAMLNVSPRLFNIILGVCLVFVVFRLLLRRAYSFDETKKMKIAPAIIIGCVLGFLSGLIGIGGGIILSPVLLLFRWATLKETSAISALFIFCNSLFGFAGDNLFGFTIAPQIAQWVIVVIAGGLLGSFLGSYKFSNLKVRLFLAGVLLFAGIKLLIVA